MSDRQDVTKRIMPNKCDVCGIGIGVSMLYFENSWRPFKHTEPNIYYYNWSGKRLRVCKECMDYLDRLENVDAYLTKLMKGRKDETEEESLQDAK